MGGAEGRPVADGRSLMWVHHDATLRHDVPEKVDGGSPKGALGQLPVEPSLLRFPPQLADMSGMSVRFLASNEDVVLEDDDRSVHIRVEDRVLEVHEGS